MNKSVELTKKLILVGIDDAKISTNEFPIIGTQALATCFGILLYNEDLHIAITSHISSKDPKKVIDKIYNIILKNKLHRINFKCIIIEGPLEKNDETRKIIELNLKDYIHIDKSSLPSDAIELDKEFGSYQFAFDTTSNTFITNKVFFGIPYLQIKNEEYKISTDFNTEEKHKTR